MEFSAGHHTIMWIILSVAVAVVAIAVAAKFLGGGRELNPATMWIKLALAVGMVALGVAVFVIFARGGG